MVDFKSVTTLLFDLDNTLLLLDEQAFIQIYAKNIHQYFENDINDLKKFTQMFLASTQMMCEKDPPNLTNLQKFGFDFSKKLKGLSMNDIIDRFLTFYKNEFNLISEIMTPDPIAKPLLILAQKHFSLVAATNPLFPAIANETRLSWGELDSKHINWKEITSADDYHYAKPDIEYYEEILEKIGKTPNECLMIGNDPINDMIAGKLGIRTYLIVGKHLNQNKIIKTSLDYKKIHFPYDYSGTLADFYKALKNNFAA